MGALSIVGGALLGPAGYWAGKKMEWQPEGFLRPDSWEPQQLLLRADRQVIDERRKFLLNNFGFEDTIMEPQRLILTSPDRSSSKGNTALPHVPGTNPRDTTPKSASKPATANAAKKTIL